MTFPLFSFGRETPMPHVLLFLLTSIAIDYVFTGGRGIAHAVGVQIQGHVTDALLLHHVRQVLPAAPVAADNDVALGSDALRSDLRHRQ